MAVSGSYVYWADAQSMAIMRVPVAGGPSEMVAPAPNNPFCIAVDQANVYWGNLPLMASEEVVMKVPIVGGTAVTLARGPLGGSSIAVYDGNVYWTTIDMPGELLKVSADGGEPTTVASNEIDPFPVAVDASGIYYGTGLTNLCDGTLSRVPSEGGATTALASGELGGPHAIATDATNIYWTIEASGNGDGMVVKLAK
jgi:hypothetical protein